MKGQNYDPERVPSYCDRVIYKQLSPDIETEVIEYKSAGILFSDHLPVIFIGKIGVRPFPKKYEFDLLHNKFNEVYH